MTQSACFAGDDHRGNWIQTASGRQFFPFDPARSDIAIEDIAHALAAAPRFTGHTKRPYSVAQHSVAISHLVPQALALEGLMHDSSEAFINDVASPVKAGLVGYLPIEEGIMVVLADRFHFAWPKPAEVEAADQLMAATEARDLMANSPTLWRLPRQPIAGLKLEGPWGFARARREFLERYQQLKRI